MKYWMNFSMAQTPVTRSGVKDSKHSGPNPFPNDPCAKKRLWQGTFQITVLPKMRPNCLLDSMVMIHLSEGCIIWRSLGLGYINLNITHIVWRVGNKNRKECVVNGFSANLIVRTDVISSKPGGRWRRWAERFLSLGMIPGAHGLIALHPEI